jgi:hypothetical protein
LFDKLLFIECFIIPAPEYLGIPIPPKPSTSPIFLGGANKDS